MIEFTRLIGIMVALIFFISPLEAGAAPENIIKQSILVSPPGYVARIKLNNPQAVEDALERAETFYINHEYADDLPEIVFVLHGPEVEIFNRNNYKKYKSIVDLAARLHAFRVVKISVCETRMKQMGEREENLFPFVGTVPFGPAEIDRLVNDENFVYF